MYCSNKAVINSETLVDSVGRESEYAWNIWASSKYLNNFDVIYSERHRGMHLPLQFDYLLDQIQLDPQYAYYQHTFVQNGWTDSLRGGSEIIEIDSSSLKFGLGGGGVEWDSRIDSMRRQKNDIVESFSPKRMLKRMIARVPKYCEVPSEEADEEMQRWINKEILIRCHATRLWVNCEFDR